MDRLDALRAFATVADRGSFAEAARQLRLSPTAVTRAVAALENRLGLLLLHRTTRSVRLTPGGALYRERCRQILDAMQDADREARGDDATPRGRLTITAPLALGRLHILPIVTRMLNAYPDLTIRLILDDRLIPLAEAAIDVAIRIGDPADSALVAIKLGEVRRILVASPDYLARRGTPDTPTALARHALIAFEGSDPTDEWHFGPTRIRVAPRLIVTSADAAIDAAVAGLGLVRTLSYQAYAALRAGRLRLVLDDYAANPVPISLLHPSRRLASPNLAAFIKAARAAFRTFPAPPAPPKPLATPPAPV